MAMRKLKDYTQRALWLLTATTIKPPLTTLWRSSNRSATPKANGQESPSS